VHLTRGRANTLRLALSGQLPGALTSDAVAAAMDLCVSCKVCKRDCPTGVDHGAHEDRGEVGAPHEHGPSACATA